MPASSNMLMRVQRLRYKDYHLASRPDVVRRESQSPAPESIEPCFLETDSVKDFGLRMQQRALLSWWRRAMGYERSDEGS
jgi:hypothetical protein